MNREYKRSILIGCAFAIISICLFLSVISGVNDYVEGYIKIFMDMAFLVIGGILMVFSVYGLTSSLKKNGKEINEEDDDV